MSCAGLFSPDLPCSKLITTSGRTWSIGGPQPQTIISPILGAGDGLSGSHNKYESDGSVTRGGEGPPVRIKSLKLTLWCLDYYLFNGDVDSVRLDKFKALYDLQPDAATANYDLDVL